MIFIFLFVLSFGYQPVFAQQNISAAEIDSQIYIFRKGSNLEIALTSRDLNNQPYVIYSAKYKNQLSQYLEKNPSNLDSLLELYSVQVYIHDLEGAKNTLTRYKNSIDKSFSLNNKNVDALLHASEYYRIKQDRFLQKNFLDSAIKYHPNSIKVKEYLLKFHILNQDFKNAQYVAYDLLNQNSKHLEALFTLININFYENAYFGIKDDYSYIQKLISENPDIPQLPFIKTYLQTYNFLLLLMDYDFDEITYKKWKIPQNLKNISDSLYNTWKNHLPYITNKAAVHTMMMIIKFIEKDTSNAKNHFQKAIEFDPYYFPAYSNYFQFQFEIENYRECIKSTLELLKYLPSENNHLMLAKAYFFAKNYYLTEEALNKVLEKKPKEPHVFTALAQYHLKFRKFNEVEKYLNLAKQIDPRDPSYNFTAAMYNILNGNKKQAKEHLLTYLEFFEKDEIAWKWLKSLYD